MYPATIFRWHDLSQINTNTTPDTIDNSPLFMQVFASDKGTEELIEVSGSDFASMYGTMSFDKYGQSAIQAQNIINHGGRLLAKRVVAKDSTLANLVILGNVTPENGSVKVKWTSQSITGCSSFDEVKEAALDLLDADAGVFPLFIFTDNGRGISNKAVKITPDYATSRTIGKMFYSLSVYEGSTRTERQTISFDPACIYNNNAYGLDELATAQISGVVDSVVYEAFIAKAAEAIEMDPAVLRNYDLIYGYTCAGKSFDAYTIDAESVDLDADNGIIMAEGSNGEFGDAPVGTDAWTQAIVEVFDGTFSPEIYDVDEHKVAAIIDANYPDEVKNAIFNLVAFREDCIFMRDYGLDLNTFIEIQDRYNYFYEEDKLNYFTCDYATSYMIKDPNTGKNIKVTMTYDLAGIMPSHIANNVFAPLAGSVNGFILESAIKGTTSFTPIITPTSNQKEAMDDLRVNYARFEGNECIVQSCYSSQTAYTQLSYICNVVAIQAVIRAVRIACPKQRYTLATGSDLSIYADAVNDVLSLYSENFDILRFTYTQDTLKATQKIFNASIEFAFLNWAQTEIFDIYAINNEEVGTTSSEG